MSRSGAPCWLLDAKPEKKFRCHKDFARLQARRRWPAVSAQGFLSRRESRTNKSRKCRGAILVRCEIFHCRLGPPALTRSKEKELARLGWIRDGGGIFNRKRNQCSDGTLPPRIIEPLIGNRRLCFSSFFDVDQDAFRIEYCMTYPAGFDDVPVGISVLVKNGLDRLSFARIFHWPEISRPFFS